MIVQVAFLPKLLDEKLLADRAVVVFDVLRATTTITAALAAGASSVRVFAELSQAIEAANAQSSRPILCGEVNCLPPAGFDLGNSPGQFSRTRHAGKDIFLATTNGTKALAVARAAPVIFAGALINASAVATALARVGRDVILLCSGTGSHIALEDVIGAGAVLHAVQKLSSCVPGNEAATMALELFDSSKSLLPQILRQTRGGRNIIAAGLEADIDFAARLDAVNIVGHVNGESLIIRPAPLV